jgi:hypothetical protein
MAAEFGPKTLEEVQALAKKKAASAKKTGQKKRQTRVAVVNTFTAVPFYYGQTDANGFDVIYVKRSTAIKYKMPEVPAGKFEADVSGRILGRNMRDSHGKTLKVSDGYVLKDRKVATKGRSTGDGGKRSISLTKAYTRRYQSIQIPQSATVAQTIGWIKKYWGVKPDLMIQGKQTIPLGLKKSKAAHAAENAAKT